jgi:hypothetical protein
MEGEDLPAEGLPLSFQGVSIEDGAGIAVNLLVVSVYDGDQVIYLVVGGEERPASQIWPSLISPSPSTT